MRGVGWLVTRAAVWWRVVWGPTLAVATAIYGVVAAFAFVRDDILPIVLSAQDSKTWQSRLAPQLHFSWYWRVTVVLAAILLLVIEGVFLVILKHTKTVPTRIAKRPAASHRL